MDNLLTDEPASHAPRQTELTSEEKDFILQVLHDTVYSGKPIQLDVVLTLIRRITEKLQAPTIP